MNIIENEYTYNLQELKENHAFAVKHDVKTYTVRIFCYKKNKKGKLIAQKAAFKITAKASTPVEEVIMVANEYAFKLNEGTVLKTKSTKV